MVDVTELPVLLGSGASVLFTFPPDGGSLGASVGFQGSTLLDATLTPGDSPTTTQSQTIDDPTLRSTCSLTADFLSGEITLTATVATPDTAKPPLWTTMFEATDRVVKRVDPCGGVIADSSVGYAPAMADTPWGPSGALSLAVTRFHIADTMRDITPVGEIVKREIFADYPPITFNTVACWGKPSPDGVGVYCDPESIWFNVFYGTYQLDCSKADGWTRPFGYRSADGVTSVVHAEDIVRLGKADWNWFSNYMYGVPAQWCRDYSHVEMAEISITPITTVTIGTSRWHATSLSGIEVATCYQSDAPGAATLIHNTIASGPWEQSYGTPCPRPEYPTSFIPNVLATEVRMSYWEDAVGFHTLVFGGTAGVRSDPVFLAAQVAAAETMIADFYPGNGFPLTA